MTVLAWYSLILMGVGFIWVSISMITEENPTLRFARLVSLGLNIPILVFLIKYLF
jgi:hypothetical protein